MIRRKSKCRKNIYIKTDVISLANADVYIKVSINKILGCLAFFKYKNAKKKLKCL